MQSFSAPGLARRQPWAFRAKNRSSTGWNTSSRARLNPAGYERRPERGRDRRGQYRHRLRDYREALGAERVTMVYRRTEHEMTAYPHEYDFVKKEGVEFRFLAQPVRVLAEDGRVIGLECVRMELGAPDSSGRRVAAAVPGIAIS